MEDKYKNVVIYDINNSHELLSLLIIKGTQLPPHGYFMVFAKGNTIDHLFRDLIKLNYKVSYVEYDLSDYIRDDDILMLSFGSDGIVSVENAYGKSKIKDSDAEEFFVSMDDCTQDIVDYCIGTGKHVTLFGKPDDYDD